jgi:adenylate kinase family enzyme
VTQRIAIVASASGNGKTTLGRTLAERLQVPFCELDALAHGPNWSELADAELRAQLAPILTAPGWVIDGDYEHKLGDLVVGAADLVVWIDLPIRVWLPRLIRRTGRRFIRREELWNGNRESIADALWGRDALFAYALRSHVRRRREWPARFAKMPTVRLRSAAEVADLAARLGP